MTYRETLGALIDRAARPEHAETIHALATASIQQRGGDPTNAEAIMGEIPALRARFPRMFRTDEELAALTPCAGVRQVPDRLFAASRDVQKKKRSRERAQWLLLNRALANQTKP